MSSDVPVNCANQLTLTRDALAEHHRERMAELLPEEGRAYLSMMGKLTILMEFLRLPAYQSEYLPNAGEGSMAAAVALAQSMDADVRKFLQTALPALRQKECLA